ncbi:hypothetical protein VKT23_017439 [Stygiomarasmius scandens]|uniref:PAH2 domain-containing protein n=1 Tax=Marasmiellus scandens TaxID=2682957 RepID=A0ABR1IWN9_9AGAR
MSSSHSTMAPKPKSSSRTTRMHTSGMLSSAQTYLSSVQSALADKPEAYEAFLGIMSDFRDGRIDIPASMHRITSLFLRTGHRDLVVGYNIFLPPGYRIEFENGKERLIVPGTTSGTGISSSMRN